MTFQQSFSDVTEPLFCYYFNDERKTLGKSGNPAKQTKPLTGAVAVWSNSPGMPTGYGEQAKLLIDLLKRDGAKVAALSNYGLEGVVDEYRSPYGPVPHYPRGYDAYSNDVVGMHYAHFMSQHIDLPKLLITLYDTWILKGNGWDGKPVASWTPLDHVTLPPAVADWLRKPNVTPIAMALHGVRQLNQAGIECEYVPHSIDTKVMKPTATIGGRDGRDYLGAGDRFVVGMVAANKASGLVHRKAFSENLLAFSVFHQKFPDSMLYLHTDFLGSGGLGWNLLKMLAAYGIPKDAVTFPAVNDYRYGVSREDLAGFYTAMDVLLAVSYGEGFGVPTVEAQACGTRVIGSSWAATPDLLADDCWMVDGTMMWDAGQDAFWMTPNVSSIVSALEQAYLADRGRSQSCIDFAKQFDVEKVWQNHWLPVLGRLLQ